MNTRPIRPLDVYDICRFWKKVRVRTLTQCWPWVGLPDATRGERFARKVRPNRYGSHGKGGTAPAHRIAFAIYTGRSTFGVLDHLCARTGGLGPACVNPLHLEEVTATENIRRGVVYAAARRADRRTFFGVDNVARKRIREQASRLRLCRNRRAA